MADVGVGFVDILPRTTAFTPALSKQVGTALTKVQGQTQSAVSKAATTIKQGLGSALSGGTGLLLGGAVIAGVGKLTLEFENAFTRIAALSNASQKDIAAWKGEVLDLAGETAQAPQELADALFFLSSAGLKASQIFPTLEASAKAAATGLGSVTDVANLTASALNAYAKQGLQAATVTDALTAAVREGRAEPDAFARALGRILPISSQANVSFQDTIASLASLSNIGLDVDESVTAMRGALQAIIAPGSLAAKTMGELGLTAQDLLDAIHEEGLIGAFRVLDEAAKANTSTQADYIGTLRKVIPNVRALTGVLGLTGQKAAAVDGIFQRVSDSTGDAGDAFQTTAEGPGFKIQQFMTELQVVAIELGDKALPSVLTALKLITPILKLAADNAGTLLTVFVGFKAINFIAGLMKSTAVATEELAAAAATAATTETAAATATTEWATQLALLNGAAKGTAATTGATGAGAFASRFATGAAAAKVGLVELVIGVKGAQSSIRGLLQDSGDLADQFKITGDQADKIKGHIEAIGATSLVHRFADPFGQFGANAEEATAAFSDFATQATQAGLSQDQINAALDAALPLLTQNRASIEDFKAALQGATDEQLAQADASAKQEQASRDATAQFFKHARGIDDLTSAIQRAAGTSNIFETMSTDIATFAANAREALRTDKWDEWAKTVREDATKAIEDFRQKAGEALNFTAQAVDDFSKSGQNAASALLDNLKKAATQTKNFAADIVEVSKVGGQAGHDLAQQLLESGDVLQAQVIADAPAKLQKQIVDAFNVGEGATSSLADQLTKRLVGTLSDISKILQAIAKQWDIRVNLGGHAKEDIDHIKGSLDGLPSQKVINIITQHTGGGRGGGFRQKVFGEAEGGIIRGAEGFIATRPTFMVGEGRSDEAVIPLDARGERFVQRSFGGASDDMVVKELRALRAVLEKGHGHELAMDGYRVGRALGVRKDRRARA